MIIEKLTVDVRNYVSFPCLSFKSLRFEGEVFKGTKTREGFPA